MSLTIKKALLLRKIDKWTKGHFPLSVQTATKGFFSFVQTAAKVLYKVRCHSRVSRTLDKGVRALPLYLCADSDLGLCQEVSIL